MKLLTSRQTADLLGIRPNTLEIWRLHGRGPKFLKLGSTKQAPIRYDEEAVMGWLNDQSFASTSAFSANGRAYSGFQSSVREGASN